MVEVTRTNVSGYVKTRSRVILNENSEQYAAVLASRNKVKEMRQIRMELRNLQKQIDDIKAQLDG